ncbi:hypothetical protein COLO4_19232 [Corchorus olitorius]|uniref:Uncharacterized protein n=1 Tax=Corchorus olitorius TaxID=93759 RepID=A0A1R3J6F1_9ROSI|nr:hypothetical protein COLO4_19232 [Corchorus olitorius]
MVRKDISHAQRHSAQMRPSFQPPKATVCRRMTTVSELRLT